MTEDPTLFQAVGTDITSLESAWSAVMPSYCGGIVESMAPAAFKECVRRYTYHRKLLTPIPGDERGITNPLIDLWVDSSATDEALDESPLVQQASAAELEEEEEYRLLEAFCRDVQKDSKSYVPWLQFQLSPAVTDGYLSRLSSTPGGPAEPILEAHELVRKAAKDSPEFSVALRAFDEIDGSALAKWHYDNCKGNSTFQSDRGVYAISYAYSLFRRGRRYGKKLRGKSYSPHWSRIPGQCLPDIDDAKPANHEFLRFADWGDVVYTLVTEKFVRCDTGALKDLLVSIRASVQSGDFDLRREAIKDQVRILEKAGVYGQPSKKLLYASAASAPQDLVENIPVIGKVLGPILGIITLLGNSRWIAKVDSKLTRIAMWNAYQKAFYVPKIVGPQGTTAVQNEKAR